MYVSRARWKTLKDKMQVMSERRDCACEWRSEFKRPVASAVGSPQDECLKKLVMCVGECGVDVEKSESVLYLVAVALTDAAGKSSRILRPVAPDWRLLPTHLPRPSGITKVS